MRLMSFTWSAGVFEAFEGGGQLGGEELGEQFGDVVVVLFENFFLPLRAFGNGAAHERCALEVLVEPQGESFVSRGHSSSLAARAVWCCPDSHGLWVKAVKVCNYKNSPPVFSTKSHMCFEKPLNMLLFETHVASRRLNSAHQTPRPACRTPQPKRY